MGSDLVPGFRASRLAGRRLLRKDNKARWSGPWRRKDVGKGGGRGIGRHDKVGCGGRMRIF